MPPIIPRKITANISGALYVSVAELTSYIIRPPWPNSPHFPVVQYCMKALKTMATTAVVKNVLQRRALRHLKQGQRRRSTWVFRNYKTCKC